MTRVMAERYAEHPALALWHVDNELGCHVPQDFSDHAAAAFRRWLESRYGSIEVLNEAWGTAFWSQRYGSFDEILPPRAAPTYPNPTQQLDFARYSSDELLAHYRALREVLAEVTPNVPATTNFMLSSATKWMDYFAWAGDVDVVANDHYVIAADPRGQIELAFAADLSRGVAGGDPWILMEHSTSAVNWQPRNRTKGPGEMLRNSLSHVARGADGIMFFQWRQSKAGAEKFHSAMVPHAGKDSDVWRGTVALGRALEALAEVAGSRVLNRVALVMDYPSWWASELDSHPTQALRYNEEMLRWYTALWDLGIGVDLVPTGTDSHRLRAGHRPDPVHGQRAGGGASGRGRPCRRPGRHHLLLRDRGRERAHLPRRLPGRVPGAAGGAHRGVLRPAGGRGAAPRRRHSR